MARMTVCPRPGCPNLTPAGTGRCPACKAQADRDRRPDGNPYSTLGHRAFREAVLNRDPICVCDNDCPSHHGRPCFTIATVADHHPHERRDLVEHGLDPNDPKYGRGLCAACHSTTTAQRTPGGWNRRT